MLNRFLNRNHHGLRTWTSAVLDRISELHGWPGQSEAMARSRWSRGLPAGQTPPPDIVKKVLKYVPVCLILVCLNLVVAPDLSFGADHDVALKALRTGDYAECIKLTSEAVRMRSFGEEWYLYKAEAELQTGDYAAAFETITNGLARYSWSIRMRFLGIEAARMTGQMEQAATWTTEIPDAAGRAPWRYSDADNLTVIGRGALAAGADARTVLEGFYDRALKLTPKHRDAWLASGELALQKKDFELAADLFRNAVKQYPEDADMQFGLARSLERSEPPLSAHALTQTLTLNPKHVRALLLRTENAIDAERYDDAKELLDQIDKINPKHPEAWAFRAVIAHLHNDNDVEKAAREAALSTWSKNPLVDHLIGRKLSQKYRFAEGAAAQKQALEFAEAYQPARVQLAEDLLRLGKEEEGWKLGEEAQKADAYDVHLFNLMTLKDQLAKYKTLEDDSFIVRMEESEAAIYGRQVLDLLNRAKKDLCPRYGLNLKDRIVVELFPEPNDFAVRTFGMPGVSGYLGVCFGRVITANSPASQKDHPSNWQAVLWHEFCHVVTLELTRNKMPRWLSEGISVFEERRAHPTWGQKMSPDSRKRILSGGLTPIRELSGAFLRPQTPADLNFAYYQSSLVVQFLDEVYKPESLRKVLIDLANGVPIDQALERNLISLDQLDAEFHDYAKKMADEFAPRLDWETYDLSAIQDEEDYDRLERWVKDHPNSLQGLMLFAYQLIERREFERAKKPLAALIELYPEQIGRGCPYELLADVHRELKDAAGERQALEAFAKRTDSAVSSLLRLYDLQAAANAWPSAKETVSQLMAINPLLPQVQRASATTAEKLNDASAAEAALESLLLMKPDDPAELHFRLAKLLQPKDTARAKTHVLDALEAAPRYREAQKLLLEIVRPQKTDKSN